MSKRMFICMITAAIGSAAADGPATHTLVAGDGEFDRSALLGGTPVSGFSLLDPARFSMRQSYSIGFQSGGGGTASSGLYLNTLSYRLASPLLLSVDLGIHSPFYSTGAFREAGGQGGPGASLVLPRVSLDYQPTRNTFISLQYINGPDAMRAFGPLGAFGSDPFRPAALR